MMNFVPMNRYRLDLVVKFLEVQITPFCGDVLEKIGILKEN